MKTIEQIQLHYAKSIGFSDWNDLLKHQLNQRLIHRDYNEVAKRYAISVAEDLRERIIQNAVSITDPDFGQVMVVDEDSIRNVEIITP